MAVAVLALLAQLVLPHVHRWQVSHGDAGATAQVTVSTPTIAPAFEAVDHAESRCPVCQSLAASHAFLLSTAYHSVPGTGSLVSVPLREARTAHVSARAHAPRSPPTLA